MKKTVIALSFALAASSLSAAQILEAIVIRVGDRIVTRTQYAKRLHDALAEAERASTPEQKAARQQEVRANLTNELISELLIKDRADRLGLTVSDTDVREAVNRLKQQYGITTDEQFAESLQKSGMSRLDMEAQLRDTLITNKVFSRELRSREELTDRELRDRYDREKERYRLPERAHLRAVIIPKPDDPAGAERAQKRAGEIAAQARLTADFATLASSIPESAIKEKGGDMGEIARGELLPDLDKAVFNSQAGTVLGPIATKSGWHIIKVETRAPSEVPAFESVKDRLRKDASEDAFQRDYKAYIDRLRKDAFIQINEQNVPTA
ncbi:MAG: putative peptidylprolyl cis-trans isomerase SurA [Acidobacteria bacterium]|nr:putative peptidylprolyl cis-trans isomerase SurA [Acidobacteriota bacterium]